MMLEMEMQGETMGVKRRKRDGRQRGLVSGCSISLYDKRTGMRAALRTTRWHRKRDGQPWHRGYRFYRYKSSDGWVRTQASHNRISLSCLAPRNGEEHRRISRSPTKLRSIINGRTFFHAEKHRMDFNIYQNRWGDSSCEFGVGCVLDGKHWVDLVAENTVSPVLVHGRWECDECMETDYEYAEAGYVKESFDSREALLLDHMQATLNAIAYLRTHTHAELYLCSPHDPANSSSVVWLRDEPLPKASKSFLIPIGAVTLEPCKDMDDPVSQWIYTTLADHIKRCQEPLGYHR